MKKVNKEAIHFIAQLDKVTTTKDGGSKITLECGSESLKSIQAIQTLNAEGDINFLVAMVAVKD